jgi:hypothetical protein
MHAAAHKAHNYCSRVSGKLHKAAIQPWPRTIQTLSLQAHRTSCFAFLSFRTVAYTPRPNATWSLSVDCLSPSCIFAFHRCFTFVVKGFSHRPLCTRVCSLSKGANCKLQLDLLHLLVVYTIVIVCYAVHVVRREPQEQRPGWGAHALLLWHQPTQPVVCSEWQPRFLAVVDLWWRSCCWDEWSETKEVGEREREREREREKRLRGEELCFEAKKPWR